LYPLSETKILLPPPKIKNGSFTLSPLGKGEGFNFFATEIALIKSSLFFATKKYSAFPPILKVV